MRLAVSSIAWPAGQDEAAARILVEAGVEGVEIAPTKVWDHPLSATPSDWAAYRNSWERRGLIVSSLQALLFGRPDLLMFGDSQSRKSTQQHLNGMIGLAAALGAGPLVFGSPKNRLVGDLSPAEADAIAVPFFRQLGEYALKLKVVFCIEPNPPAYGCDYIKTAAEGLDLVARVDHPGFGLHLDAAGMTLAGDDPGSTFATAERSGHWRHFHLSEPQLAPIDGSGTNHSTFGSAVRASGHDGWAVIEMRDPGEGWEDTLRSSIRFAQDHYFCD
ncbi:hypothetical protein BH23PLA1_BH23PLA1_12680 [soil metagenome]